MSSLWHTLPFPSGCPICDSRITSVDFAIAFCDEAGVELDKVHGRGAAATLRI